MENNAANKTGSSTSEPHRRFRLARFLLPAAGLVILGLALWGVRPSSDDTLAQSNDSDQAATTASPGDDGAQPGLAASDSGSATSAPDAVSPTTALTTAPAPTSTPSTTAASTTTVDPAQGPYGLPADLDRAYNLATGDPNTNTVLLTFDAGAERGEIERTLDLLRDEDIQAAFAFVGPWVTQNADAVQRLVDEGHVLVNHSDNHPSFTGFSNDRGRLSDAARRETVIGGDQVLIDTVGVSSKPLFRPPYGDMDDDGLVLVAEMGYPVNLMWTIDCGGWLRIPAAETLERCMNATGPGTIYLLHVGHESLEIDMLPEMIELVRAQGLEFADVDEFITTAVAADPQFATE